jgi:hypothetical protein
MNESYESWLRIIPLEIYSTTAKLKGSIFITNGNEMQYRNTDRQQTRIKV